MVLQNKYGKKYSGIEDLPMYNWLELTKQGTPLSDAGYLLVTYKKVTPTVELKVLWTKIYDQYIKEIGLTPDYRALLEAMKQCTQAMIDSALEPSSLNATKEARAKKIIELMTTGKVGKFSEFVAAVEKYMGLRVDLKTISVERFYSYVGLMQKEMEAMRG
jgi:hypothetical protein